MSTTSVYRSYHPVKTTDPTERVFPKRPRRVRKVQLDGSGLSKQERNRVNRLLYGDDEEGID